MRNIIGFILFFFAGFLFAQKTELTLDDYGFQIKDYSIPLPLPKDYESVKTVELDNKLYPNKKYRVGFWVTASKGPEWLAFTYDLCIFPSNFMDILTREDRCLSKSEDVFARVYVPPNMSSEHKYLSFIVSPDTTYTHITIGLEKGVDAFFNMKDCVSISGIFVEPLLKKSHASSNNDRELIDKGETFTVLEEKVTIMVYDHKRVDNDIVSIYLNGNKLIDKLTLKRKKKKFRAKLQYGTNTIRLHADNLGEVSPNTAAIIIKSGNQIIEQILTSDLNQSEYFTVIYKPE